MRNLHDWHVGSSEERGLLVQCREAVRSVLPDALTVLYGSRSRGDATGDSDYDLLVLVEQEPTMLLEDRVREALYPIELETGAVLTVFLESRARWETPLYRAMPFVRSVQAEGVVL